MMYTPQLPADTQPRRLYSIEISEIGVWSR